MRFGDQTNEYRTFPFENDNVHPGEEKYGAAESEVFEFHVTPRENESIIVKSLQSF